MLSKVFTMHYAISLYASMRHTVQHTVYTSEKLWKSIKDISENGQGYDGKINVDWEGRKCISWEKHIQTYQKHYHRKTKHNVCRNFHIDSPVVFCLVNKGRNVELSPCNVALCPKQENFDVWAFSDLGERKPSKCNFPFKRLGKYFSKVIVRTLW